MRLQMCRGETKEYRSLGLSFSYTRCFPVDLVNKSMARKKKERKKYNLGLMLMCLKMAILVGNGNFCLGFLSIDGA